VDWRVVNATGEINAARPRVRMATNNGEQAHDWALSGMGLVFRSIWDVKQELANGELIQLLPDWRSESAPIRIVFPSRQFLPARTRLFIDYLAKFFKSENEARANY
jgi:DNA-binding transcriptional LysR family regulator